MKPEELGSEEISSCSQNWESERDASNSILKGGPLHQL